VLKQANAISGSHDAGFETSKPSSGVVAYIPVTSSGTASGASRPAHRTTAASK
jgi:hypothetical protein